MLRNISEQDSGPRNEGGHDSTVISTFGPASLSNLGPGFDTLGLCMTCMGDVIEAWRIPTSGVRVELGTGPVVAPVPTDPARNTAAQAARVVLEQAGADDGLVLRIRKGITIGSGIGGSAASAAAGAWAANALLGYPFEKADLVEAVLTGEEVASGSRHGDNALPALFGGLILTSPADPAVFRRIPISRSPTLALIVPEVQILTSSARTLLAAEVAFRDAVHNASDLAFMVDAFRAGDWATVGRHMMRDRFVEPVRAALVPCYDRVRAAALEAGAHGCALTGSGPAMFALTGDAVEARNVLEAMQRACERSGIACTGYVTSVDQEGVRTLLTEAA